jgi:hypothetical protein
MLFQKVGENKRSGEILIALPWYDRKAIFSAAAAFPLH